MNTSDSEVCPNCGNFVTTSEISELTGWCKDCTPVIYSKLEDFLAINADHLEHYMLQGNSFTKSLKLLHNEVRATCASCGGFIVGGGRNSVFCAKKPKCRSAARRYKYLYTSKGLTKPQALSQILEELT